MDNIFGLPTEEKPELVKPYETRSRKLKMRYKFDVSVVLTLLDPDLKRIKRTLDSALVEQGDLNIQVVVVNDGSCLDFASKHPRIKIVNLEHNEGIASAKNTGIAQAEGEWIICMGDDVLSHMALNDMVAILRQHDQPGDWYGYGDVGLPGGVHETPEWERHTPEGGGLKTSAFVVWHISKFGECRYFHPVGEDVYIEDYDFIVQLELAGVNGLKVPGVLAYHEPGEVSRKIQPDVVRLRQVMWSRFGK